MKQYAQIKIHPRVEDVLRLVGSGLMISALFLFPGAGIGIKVIMDEYERQQRKREKKELDKFDLSRLRYTLRRLQKQKLVRIVDENGTSSVQLTQKGSVRMLRYRLEDIMIRIPQKWDKKWRLIFYDISKFKKQKQDAFRFFLKRLKMVPLQRSVYLTPYPCEKEIIFLREHFDIADCVLYVVTDTIEDQSEYIKYFGL